MANDPTQFTMTRGQTLVMEFTAFAAGTDPTELTNRKDLTLSALRFAMKLNASSVPYEIRLDDAADPTQVALSGAQGVADETRGKYQVTLFPADTNVDAPNNDLPLGHHVFDAWVTDNAGADRFPVITGGTILILDETDDLENP